MSVESH